MKEDNEINKLIDGVTQLYIKSEEYMIGKKMCFLIENIKKKRYIYLMKKVFKKLFFSQKSDVAEKAEIQIPSGIFLNSDNEYKIAIYTCIAGNYDKVKEPITIEQNCDYFLFTNNKEIKSKVWKIKEIPNNISKLNNNVDINRYIKMHPYEFFAEYDYAVYIDGNVRIVFNISNLVNKTTEATGLAIHRHNSNKNVYDEIKNCLAYKKGNLKKLKEVYKKFKREKMPTNFPVYQCNLIVSKMNNLKGKQILEEWWNEFVSEQSCKRDQIYLPYVLWKCKYRAEDIGNLGNDITLNNTIMVENHKK